LSSINIKDFLRQDKKFIMIAFLDITIYTKMVHTITIAEKWIKEVTADCVNRKRLMSTGAPPPPPPSKRQSFSSGSEPFERRYASASHVSVSVSQCNKCGRTLT
jgi:hypothetical protein